MELKYRLLDHPFYQAWSHGTVTLEQLSKYHKSYNEFIELMPKYWEKVNIAFNPDSRFGKRVVEDETRHIELWQQWAGNLPAVDSFPRMTEVIEALNAMTPSQLLGAIQAFEIQQPEVATTKKEGLLCKYGMNESETVYFDDHIEEEAHIAYGMSLKERFANKEEFNEGFEIASKLYYDGLTKYMN